MASFLYSLLEKLEMNSSRLGDLPPLEGRVTSLLGSSSLPLFSSEQTPQVDFLKNLHEYLEVHL